MAASPEPKCPTCGASVRYKGNPQVVECRYCQSHIDTRAWVTTAAPAAVRSLTPSSRLGLFAALLAGGVVVVGVLVVLATSPRSTGRGGSGPASAALSPTAPGAAGTSAVASGHAVPPGSAGGATDGSPDGSRTLADVEVLLEFGEQGDADGQFNDPRQIAVGSQGDIVVADYRSLRIQRFDADGTFRQRYQLRPGRQSEFITGLALEGDRALWVTRGGDLLKLDLSSGRLTLARLNREPKLSYGALALGPDGAVYVQNFGATSSMSSSDPPQVDNLRKLSKGGQLLRTWSDVASGPVTTDRQGNVYVADKLDRRIDVLDPEGKLKTRIGGGDRPGWDLGLVSALAVDSRGRLYVLAGDIHVLDPVGQPLSRFDSKGARSLAIDADDAIYSVTSYCRVIKQRVTFRAGGRPEPAEGDGSPPGG